MFIGRDQNGFEFGKILETLYLKRTKRTYVDEGNNCQQTTDLIPDDVSPSEDGQSKAIEKKVLHVQSEGDEINGLLERYSSFDLLLKVVSTIKRRQTDSVVKCHSEKWKLLRSLFVKRFRICISAKISTA